MLVHDLDVVASDREVGLFCGSDGKRKLKVPFGMEDMPAQQALATLYKSFVVFRQTQRSRERLAALDGVETQSGNGLESGDDGVTFHDALALDELFDRIDPTRLLSLAERRAKTAVNAHTRIDRNLHLALFNEDGVPYLERASGSRREVRYGSGDIVGLYCLLAEDFYARFLRVDLQSAWGRFAPEGVAIAAEFRHRYLGSDASLYDEDADECRHTLHHLRHILRTIDRNTPFRNADYRALHDALERYLHSGVASKSKEGLIWGVNNFWAVWESVCLLQAALDDYAQFLTCDFEHLPATLSDPVAQRRWLQQRRLLFAHNEIARRPDLVLASTSAMRIIDFKFYAHLPATRPKQGTGAIDKLERDFLSIEIYGLQLQNHLLRSGDSRAGEVALELWLPGRTAARALWQGAPAWNPPLSIVTLPTAELMKTYSCMYEDGHGLRA